MPTVYTTNHPPLYYIVAGFLLAAMFFDFVFIIGPKVWGN
jgi:uncharacterized membrane protein